MKTTGIILILILQSLTGIAQDTLFQVTTYSEISLPPDNPADENDTLYERYIVFDAARADHLEFIELRTPKGNTRYKVKELKANPRMHMPHEQKIYIKMGKANSTEQFSIYGKGDKKRQPELMKKEVKEKKAQKENHPRYNRRPLKMAPENMPVPDEEKQSTDKKNK